MRAPILFYLLLLLVSVGYCQQYLGEAQVPKVPKDGFYQIAITSKIGGYLVPGFTNLRIVNKANKEVPYIIRAEAPVRQSKEFHEYELELYKTNVRTELVLKNPERKTINNIHLKIRNADVLKEATLLGSDDHKSWFAIKQKFSLSSINGGNGTFEMRVLDFPMTNYLFYSFRISDSLSAPINILTAGYYESNIESGQYVEVPGKITFSSDIKKKQSILKFSFDTIQFVDRIDLKMKGKQQYFLRRASLEETRERKLKKGQIEKYQYALNEFEASSTHATQLDIEGSRFSQFQIVFNNEDNPPLELGSLQAFQLNRYIIAWLSSSNEYNLKIGSENLPAPSYDLRFFSDSIPSQIPSLTIGDVLVQKKKISADGLSIFTSKNFIWAAILIVAMLLGYIAVNLAKDVGKSSSKE